MGNINYASESLIMHEKWRGKLEICSKAPVCDKHSLSLAYTPGVAAPCREIAKNEEASYALTGRANAVAVVTDGSAVLGLGDIGALASMPVMEGKCVLFKEFGGIDAYPICVNSRDINEIVRTVKLIEGGFGAVNLEDISAPRCFEIDRLLRETLSIPVFHDDQYGTAVVVLAALINALRLIGKAFFHAKVVINGAGAAGCATARLLLAYGVTDIIMCDRRGVIYRRRDDLTGEKKALAELTNRRINEGGLRDAVIGADVFIGLSAPNVLTGKMVRSMADGPVIFAMANPDPEILPDEAKKAGAKVVGTGRSDFPNQINNVLAFPGIIRGVLDVRARLISANMLMEAARALAALVSGGELSVDYILPEPFDGRVLGAVSKAVADAAVKEKLNRVQVF